MTKNCPLESGKIKGNMWSQYEFTRYLTEKTGYDVWQTRIKPRIQNIITWSLISVQEYPVNRAKSFELFGYDVMIDSELNPWLIEVNSSPSMDYSTVTRVYER